MRKANRLISLMLALMMLLSVPAASAYAVDGGSPEESGAAASEQTAEDDGINYDRYPVVTEKQGIKLINTALKQQRKTVRFRIEGRSDDNFDYAEELLYRGYGRIPDYYLYGQMLNFCEYDFSIPEKGCYEFEFDYRFSKKKNNAFEKKLKKVEKSLKLNGLSDKKKALKIYKWITKNIKYDYKRARAEFTNGDEASAYNALIKRKAVCQGIAALYYRMLRDAGVDACFVRGMAGSSCGNITYGYNDWHAWVLVKVKGKWYNTDPTWDLGNKKFKWFLKKDKSFTGHKRDPEFRTKDFKAKHPMGKKNLKY